MPHRILALLLVAGALAAADAVDRALADWNQDAMRAREACDAALSRADDKAVKAYQSAANAASRKGDHPSAAAAWRAVLEINRANSAAREYFAATGALAEILAQLDQPIDLLGNPLAKVQVTLPPDAASIAIGTQPGQGHILGSLRAGQRVLFQYEGGLWSPQKGQRPSSPDDPSAPATCRLVMVDGTTADAAVIAIVGPGTKTAPFTYTAPERINRAVLRMQPGANPSTASGQVRYRVAVLP